MPLVQMNGITNQAGLTQLATRLDSTPLVVLYTFPLYLLGAVLFAAAAVPRWAALCVGVGGLFPLAIVTGAGPLALPIAALRIAGSTPVIKTLLVVRET